MGGDKNAISTGGTKIRKIKQLIYKRTADFYANVKRN